MLGATFNTLAILMGVMAGSMEAAAFLLLLDIGYVLLRSNLHTYCICSEDGGDDGGDEDEDGEGGDKSKTAGLRLSQAVWACLGLLFASA